MAYIFCNKGRGKTVWPEGLETNLARSNCDLLIHSLGTRLFLGHFHACHPECHSCEGGRRYRRQSRDTGIEPQICHSAAAVVIIVCVAGNTLLLCCGIMLLSGDGYKSGCGIYWQV